MCVLECVWHYSWVKGMEPRPIARQRQIKNCIVSNSHLDCLTGCTSTAKRSASRRRVCLSTRSADQVSMTGAFVRALLGVDSGAMGSDSRRAVKRHVALDCSAVWLPPIQLVREMPHCEPYQTAKLRFTVMSTGSLPCHRAQQAQSQTSWMTHAIL